VGTEGWQGRRREAAKTLHRTFVIFLELLSDPLLSCLLQGWDPVIDEVLKATPSIDLYPLESAEWLQHLAYDRIAILGDAAHREYFAVAIIDSKY
jgi:2-polyprenyl-6-methoxyphenol hydroxylase-like FAD-dependent oxidoreductase